MKEKVKKFSKLILEKGGFISQFIFTLIFITLLYFMITTHEYQGYWSRDLLLWLIPTGLIAILMMLYNVKQYYKIVEKMFLTVAIPIGILFLVFMLPNYIPDAAAHEWRAYEISQGDFLGREDSKVVVPKDLQENRENIAKYNQYNKLLEKQTNYNDVVETPSPAKSYSFILYLPTGTGMLIGRLLGLNVFVSTYIARNFNLIIFLIAGYFAIKKIPFGKKVLGIYMLMPMVIQQAVSFSADSIMNTAIFFYIAYVIYLLFKQEQITKKEKVLYMVLMVFVGISKATYIPIIALGFPIFFKDNMKTKKEKIIFIILSIVICLTSYLGLAIANRGNVNETATDYLTTNNVNSDEQIKYLLENPLRVIKVLYENNLANGQTYLYQMVGDNFGWLSISVPSVNVLFMIIIIVVAIFIEKNEVSLNKLEKAWTLLLAFGMYALVNMGLYLEWTGVGQAIVAGVQGRYFIPIAILPLLCCCMKNNYVKLKYGNILIFAGALVVNIFDIIEIAKFFL